jgi:radical SAM protein with 4Fe4S-binding SPASM domain
MSESILTGDHAFCAAVQGKLLEFDIDGSIKICGYSSTTIGGIDHFDEMFEKDSGFYQMIENRFPGTDKYCLECSIEGACAGQCNVTREAISRLPEKQGLLLKKDMCDFYRLVTEKLIKEYIESVESEQKGGDIYEENAHT